MGTGLRPPAEACSGARDDSHIPPRLTSFETLDAAEATTTRDLLFRSTSDGAWTINDNAFDPRRINAAPRLGDVEIWRFTADFHHPIHLHLVQFQILSRNGEDPGPYDRGWKDVIDLRPAEQAAVIAMFAGHRGRYVFHCHDLESAELLAQSRASVRVPTCELAAVGPASLEGGSSDRADRLQVGGFDRCVAIRVGARAFDREGRAAAACVPPPGLIGSRGQVGEVFVIVEEALHRSAFEPPHRGH